VVSTIEASSPRSESSAAAPIVSWVSWPLVDAAPYSALLVMALSATGLLAAATTGRTVWAVAVPLVLAACGWRFFVPVRYELDKSGVTQQVHGWVQRTLWTDVRSFDVCPRGVMLFSHTETIPLDAFRGVYLPWGERRDEVLSAVRFYLE
jgi:hypothetical protein